MSLNGLKPFSSKQNSYNTKIWLLIGEWPKLHINTKDNNFLKINYKYIENYKKCVMKNVLTCNFALIVIK